MPGYSADEQPSLISNSNCSNKGLRVLIQGYPKSYQLVCIGSNLDFGLLRCKYLDKFAILPFPEFDINIINR